MIMFVCFCHITTSSGCVTPPNECLLYVALRYIKGYIYMEYSGYLHDTVIEWNRLITFSGRFQC